MIHQGGNVAENTKLIKITIDKAEALIIGAGASLSRIHYVREVAGLACDNAEAFNTLLL
jgi:hypothetical protein